MKIHLNNSLNKLQVMIHGGRGGMSGKLGAGGRRGDKKGGGKTRVDGIGFHFTV